MSISFAELGVPKPLNAALSQRGITEPFPIQVAVLPDALKGRDVSGQAPTGSGKTLAFGLAVLARVARAASGRPRALILAPTRELADQINVELTPPAHAVDRRIAPIYGGVAYGPQMKALRSGVDVLVATPGRLEDLIDQRIVNLGDVDIVVVDEADRMADMGFLPAVKRILDRTAQHRQTMLFSATLDGEIGKLSDGYQTSPARHVARSVTTNAPEASHHFWLVDRDERIDKTLDAIAASEKTIVFTRTRHGADRLARQIGKRGADVVAMHGGRSQTQRKRALAAFSSGRASALIATDVAARGIHVDDVSTVVHYDLAQDSTDYVHRSGRTARAGAGGTVISLVMPDQRKTVTRMQRELGMRAPIHAPGSIAAGHNRPTAQPSRTIFVGNLPWKTSEGELHQLFSRHGNVVDTTVARKNGRSKGYGFVEMSEDNAGAAIEAVAGSALGGRRLQVRFAR